MAVAHVTTTAANGADTAPTVAYQASIAAGDFLVAVLHFQGSVTAVPSGFVQVGSTVSVASVSIAVYWKVAAGTESGTNWVGTLSSTANWRVHVSRFTGSKFSGSSIFNFATGSNSSSASTIAAPNQGSVATGQVGFASAAGYNGTGGTDTVSGTGWTKVVSGNYASPNETAEVAVSDATATGACTFNFINAYATQCAVSMIIREATGGNTLFWSM